MAHHHMLDDTWWAPFSLNAQDYDLGSPIGFGASSTVYAAAFNLGPDEWRECAIKVSSSHSDHLQLSKEAHILALCRHPNVLRVLASFTLPPDHSRVAIVTPLITGGSLLSILDWRARNCGDIVDRKDRSTRRPALDEDEIKAVVRQVMDGLVYLHANGFLHRDLKAGNLLICPDGTIVLADFGVGGDANQPSSPTWIRPTVEALRFDTPRTHIIPAAVREAPPVLVTHKGKRASIVGTPNWMAPEIALGQLHDTKADIWSLGITIIELAHGSAPGSRTQPADALAQTINGNAPILGSGFSKHMREFVNACLQKDAIKRPSAAQLHDHPWLRGAKKSSFLAQSLLHDIAPLMQRQELRRVPTVSSIVSRAPSWDFTYSVPPSPAPRIKSPSAQSLYDYFTTTRSSLQSRPTTSARGNEAAPPSPRISLHRWAEQTGGDSMPGTPTGAEPSPRSSLVPPRRTGSEVGRTRSSASLATRAIRRDNSLLFHDGIIGPVPESVKERMPRVQEYGLPLNPEAASLSPTPLTSPSTDSATLSSPTTVTLSPLTASPEVITMALSPGHQHREKLSWRERRRLNTEIPKESLGASIVSTLTGRRRH